MSRGTSGRSAEVARTSVRVSHAAATAVTIKSGRTLRTVDISCIGCTGWDEQSPCGGPTIRPVCPRGFLIESVAGGLYLMPFRRTFALSAIIAVLVGLPL